MSSTLIRRATCVLPEGTGTADVLIADDKIVRVDAPVGTRADHTVDARGLHLIPGVVDDQVHFREPGLEHKEDLHTGSLACAKGGVTTFLEMPNTNPTTTTVEALHDKLARARSKSVVNYGFYVGATGDNVVDLRKARRTPGIKIFIGSSTGDLLVDEQTALERIFAETTLPICAHCEDETTVRENRAASSRGAADAGRPFPHPRSRGGAHRHRPRARPGGAPRPPLPRASRVDPPGGGDAGRLRGRQRRRSPPRRVRTISSSPPTTTRRSARGCR